MIGKLHPLLVHLPVGMILLAVAACWHNGSLQRALPFLWTIAGGTALLSALTGWTLAQSTQNSTLPTLIWHQWLNWCLCACLLLLAVAEWRQWLAAAPRRWLSALPVLLLAAGTYTGASLTHGTGFLWKKKAVEVFGKAIGTVAASDVPTTEAPIADPKALLALRQKGVLVMPVAENSHWLMVNGINAPQFSDADAALLLPIAPQLVWLKLSDTQLRDSALFYIGQLPNLTRLYLDNTRINGSGLPALRSLQRLRILNLSGTDVRTDMLEALRGMPALETIFLFGTPIDSTVYKNILPKFPSTHLDTGGYIVPILQSDTSRLKAAKSY